MTAGEALQAAVNLVKQAREAADSGQDRLALVLSSEAQSWALISMAIEAGAPAPTLPDSQPGDFPTSG